MSRAITDAARPKVLRMRSPFSSPEIIADAAIIRCSYEPNENRVAQPIDTTVDLCGSARTESDPGRKGHGRSDQETHHRLSSRRALRCDDRDRRDTRRQESS